MYPYRVGVPLPAAADRPQLEVRADVVHDDPGPARALVDDDRSGGRRG